MVKVSVNSGFSSREDAWELLPGGVSRYLGGSNTRQYESTPDTSKEVEGNCVLHQTEYEGDITSPLFTALCQRDGRLKKRMP